jgi:hypothetical protein
MGVGYSIETITTNIASSTSAAGTVRSAYTHKNDGWGKGADRKTFGAMLWETRQYEYE